jgi:Txe/YoeB family toxin of Txe-Axe toxin-antitoxin module
MTCDLALMRRHSRTAWRWVDKYHRGLGGVLENYAVRNSKSHRCVTDAVDREVNQLAAEQKAEKMPTAFAG